MPKPTQPELKKIVKYNPKTGIFTWLISTNNRALIGSEAGCKDGCGYIKIMVNGKQEYAHRLAWLYVNGYFPENDIDHINRDKSDNKISNLRHVSHRCNTRNCKVAANSKTGVTGVTVSSRTPGWFSYIYIDYGKIYLGFFKNFKDAVEARWEAEKKYNYPNCNTTSSAYLYLKAHYEK